MRSAHYLPLSGTQLHLPNSLLATLEITEGCLLYAARALVDADLGFIFSPIPPQKWSIAYRLDVNVAALPGSLARITSSVASRKMNIFSCWSASTNAHGEGWWTAIIELASQADQDLVDALRKDLQREFRDLGALAAARTRPGDPEAVLLRPLSLLRSVANDVRRDGSYIGKIKGYAVDLASFRDRNDEDLFSEIAAHVRHLGHPIPDYCLLSPNPDEKYFRVALLPPKSRLMEMEMEVSVRSSTGAFAGFYSAVLGSLAELGANVYGSQNLLLAKSFVEADGETNSQAEEVARFEFVADTSRLTLPREPDRRLSALYETVDRALRKHAEKSPPTTVIIERNSFRVATIEDSFPWCFLSTNARRGEDSIRFAQVLLNKLRSLRLDPVNVVDVREPQAIEDVMRLLRSCPFLVSLHLPTKGTAIINADTNLAENPGDYAPADWVMFEETFMRALGRRVFRLRHRKVRQPRYARGEYEYPFDESDFETVLARLATAIEHEMASERYERAFRESTEYSKKCDAMSIRQKIELSLYHGVAVSS